MSIWPWLLTVLTTGVAFILGNLFCSRRHGGILKDKDIAGSCHYKPEDIMQALKVQRHAFLNDLQVISGWLQLNNLKKCMEYIQEVKRRLQEEATLARTVDSATALILFLKMAEAGNKGVHISYEVQDCCVNLSSDARFAHALEFLLDVFMELLAAQNRSRLNVLFSRKDAACRVEMVCPDVVLGAGRLSEISATIDEKLKKIGFGFSIMSDEASGTRLIVTTDLL